MKLVAELRLPLQRSSVLAAHRDRMAQILEFLPNVRAVELRSREARGPVVLSSSDWHGGGEVPAPVRGIVSNVIETARWFEKYCAESSESR